MKIFRYLGQLSKYAGYIQYFVSAALAFQAYANHKDESVLAEQLADTAYEVAEKVGGTKVTANVDRQELVTAVGAVVELFEKP